MPLKVNSTEQIEEKLNAYSHGVGVILSFIGGYFLFKQNFGNGFRLDILIYVLSLILLFTASTLYHGVSNPKRKRKLRVLDHISIYYLIAGTYTPACLMLLIGSKGILLLYLVWGIAIFGTILKLFFTGKFEAFSLLLYAVMGWLVVIDLNHLLANTSSIGLVYLGLGGAFYTVGILFYAVKKIPFNHFIWHLFVLGGAIFHWLFIYKM